MRTRFIPLFILSLFFTFSVIGQNPSIDSPESDKWTSIDSLMNLGLIKSAEPEIDKIYIQAKRENNIPDYFKSLIYKIEISKTDDDFDINTVVEQLKIELNEAPSPQGQILHSILAEVYFNHYQKNQWKINDRTNINHETPEDVNTWSIQNYQKKIKSHLLSSLADSELLFNTKIESLETIMEGNTIARNMKPTLFDLLVYRLTNYYTQVNLFQVKLIVKSDKNLDYFFPVKDFLEVKIDTNLLDIPNYYILQLYQQTLSLHENDVDKTAFIQADLERIKFVKTHFFKKGKYELNYLNSLNNIISSFPKHESIAEVKYEKARIYTQRGNRYDPLTSEDYQWEKQKSVDICRDVIKDFPNSVGAKYCKEMLKNLEAKHLNLQMNSIQLPNTPILASIDYKNCKKLYFKIVELNYSEEKALSEYQRIDKRLMTYLKKETVENWVQDIPYVQDFQAYNAQIRIPEVNEGYYILLASSSADFNEKDLLHSTYFWASNLSFINRSDGKGGQDLFVLHRKSGKPMQNVKLEVFERNYNYNNRKKKMQKKGTYVSDKYGFIHLQKQSNYSSKQLVFSYKSDTLVENTHWYGYSDNEKQESTIVTNFFTDRKIYRPGQTVYFKGLSVIKHKDRFEIYTKNKTKVIFQDVNRKEISTHNFITNEFGSFHGSFIIPENVLNGNMIIRNENGSISFSVEEYKRPSFEIQFDALKDQYRINDTVTIGGVIESYSGSKLSNAKLKYTIMRSQYSYWNFESPWYRNAGEQIFSGELKTDDNGRFQIRFLASSNKDLNEALKMIYNYRIEVDATDMNGETQSASKSIPISFTNLRLRSDITSVLEKNTTKMIPISAVNFSGEKQEVNVSISVFKLVHPEKAYKSRKWKRPSQFIMDRESFHSYFPNSQYDDENNKDEWDVKNQVFQAEINTAEVDGFEIYDLANWQDGAYKMILKTRDQFDEEIESIHHFTLFSADSKRLALADFNWFNLSKEKVIPGDTTYIVVGSSAKNVSVLYELQQNNKVLANKRFNLNREQRKIEIPINKTHIGDLIVNIVFVKDNEIYSHKKNIKVSDPERELNIRLETFRPILSPSGAEEWKIKISGNNNQEVSAELLCVMTDISLESFRPNNWNLNFNINTYNTINWSTHSGFVLGNGRNLNRKYYGSYFSEIQYSFEDFFWNFSFSNDMLIRALSGKVSGLNIAPISRPKQSIAADYVAKDVVLNEVVVDSDMENEMLFTADSDLPDMKSNVSDIKIRKNFSETAFFYPDLQTDKEGNIILKFTSPEALTRWKFMALAHTKDLRTAQLTQEVITQKELMLSPNIPRFFRQGDTLYFNTKISNLTDETLKGITELQFFDAENMQKVELLIEDIFESLEFEISAKSNINKEWKIFIPDNVSALVYRLTAVTDKYSDGEERMIAVLSNRMLVTESLPIHINADEEKTLNFERLLQSDSLQTIKHYSLKLEMTSNPNWYAIQALPQVADTKQENAIALFNRYYANVMAMHLMNSNPRIKRVFDQWENISPDAFLSNLEKNQELKSVLLAETPWLMEAQNESEQKRRLALFFELNTMEQELGSNFEKLMNLQLNEGSWTWYNGGRGSRYITQHILTGLLRLKHRNVIDSDQWRKFEKPIQRAITYLNKELKNDFEDLKKREEIILDEDHLRSSQIHYLFALSYADEAPKLNEEMKTVLSYYLDQAQKYWMKRNPYLQAMIALTLSRNADDETADLIMRSLKERSSSNDEMGMYWKQDRGYYWYQAPIETQALLIEAFLEINNDKVAVREMKKWLIKQKQTQMWSTPKASVEAVNALLLEGVETLAATKNLEVKLGGTVIKPEKQEAGTGYYEFRWNGEEVKAKMGTIELINKNKQIAWGALHWQYFENLDKITTYETPLKIEKQLFVKERNGILETLIPVNENRIIKIGDKIVSRIVIRVDRDMEFVHLKDMRASAFEPRNVNSRYRCQNGLGYYESTKDAATHFYFDRLRKGTYVFEYEMFVSQKGEFSNGITTIQCMYAPEFMSHSEGVRVVVTD